MKSSQVKQGLRALTLLLALVLVASTTWFAAPLSAQAEDSVLTLSAASTVVSETGDGKTRSNAPPNPGEKVGVKVTISPAPTSGTKYLGCNLRAADGGTADMDDYFIPAKGKAIKADGDWKETFNFWVIDDAVDDDDETLVLEAFCTSVPAGDPPAGGRRRPANDPAHLHHHR